MKMNSVLHVSDRFWTPSRYPSIVPRGTEPRTVTRDPSVAHKRWPRPQGWGQAGLAIEEASPQARAESLASRRLRKPDHSSWTKKDFWKEVCLLGQIQQGS